MTHPLLEEVLRYAESHLGVPYLFGGNNRLVGLDCSGYVGEVLRSVGLIGVGEDLSAQGLYEKFIKTGRRCDPQKPQRGALVFYGPSLESISHVALATSALTVIEASGGDANTRTLEEAQRRGACVRKRWVGSRRDPLIAIYPRYPWD